VAAIGTRRHLPATSQAWTQGGADAEGDFKKQVTMTYDDWKLDEGEPEPERDYSEDENRRTDELYDAERSYTGIWEG
jgi:hypothetical protein